MTGDELKSKRLEMDLTQDQLALELGVDRNTVARWERSERTIPPYLALALKCLPQVTGDKTETLVKNRKTGRPKKLASKRKSK